MAQFKLAFTLMVGQYRAKIYRDTDWREWRTRFYDGAQYLGENRDAHTDDKADAIGTAQSELWRMAGMEDIRQALMAYRAEHPANWRHSLSDLWTSGKDAGELRAARNRLGPDWLMHRHGAIATL